jgi:hypothetical protein
MRLSFRIIKAALPHFDIQEITKELAIAIYRFGCTLRAARTRACDAGGLCKEMPLKCHESTTIGSL